jgi:membrane-associated phospholipid phosphatase
MVMMAIGRIFFGYHYPSDAIVGMLLGIATGLAVYFIAGHLIAPSLFTGVG